MCGLFPAAESQVCVSVTRCRFQVAILRMCRMHEQLSYLQLYSHFPCTLHGRGFSYHFLSLLCFSGLHELEKLEIELSAFHCRFL